MDLTRVDRGLQIAGASGGALVVFMFFPWYGRSAGALPNVEIGVNATAWRAFEVIDLILLAVAAFAVAVAAIAASGREVRLPLPPSTIVTALGILAVVLVAYRLIEPPLDLDRRYGVYFGLLAAVGIAIGGRLAMGARDETFADARDSAGEQVSKTRRRAAQTIDDTSSSNHENRTKEELYEEASRRGIEGRSEMSKEELAKALNRR